MKQILRNLFLSLTVLMLLFISTSCTVNVEKEFKFEYWNNCDSLTNLEKYVENATNEKSDNYIPVEDRIAVFDMDGTLYGELFPTYFEYLFLAHRVLDDPNYTASEELVALGNEIMTSAAAGSFASDMPMRHALGQAEAFKGLTLAEFDNCVKEFMKLSPAGFTNMTYGEAFYVPMLEVISYLNLNDFLTYIVSGSDRFICRSLASEACNIPYERIIGMDVELAATGQGDTDGLNYVYKDTDTVIRTNNLLIKNLKMNKVKQIAQEIGRQPVLSFGNSSGDVSMHMYTISNNKYRSAAFMLIADDEVRDYGNTEKANKLAEEWREYGFNVISMRDDFKYIYDPKVVRN